MTKLCFGDGKEVPSHVARRTEFNADKTRDDGLCVYCRTCQASRSREWKRVNHDKVLESKRAYRRNQKLKGKNE